MKRLSRFKLVIVLISFVILSVFMSCPNGDDPPVVEDVDVTSVTLDKSELVLEVDKTTTLVATVLPNNATNKAVSWSSSDTTKATVSASGVVTAKALGDVTITVTTEDGEKTAACVVTVISAISAEAEVEALDFGVMTFSNVMGYTVGFGFEEFSESDVKSVVVELLKDDVVLATNTMTGLFTKYPGSPSWSAPFDVFGEFDYEDDGCWDYSGWDGEVSDVPTKAVITVTLKNDVKKVATNVSLTGDTTIFSANVAILNKASGYNTIQDAIDDVSDGDTILLVEGIELKNTLTINKSITLDLNGKTLKTPNVVAKSPIMVLQIQGGTTDVTIKGVGLIQSGSTTNHTSRIDNNPSIWVWQGASLTIKNGSTIRGADAINSYEAAPAIWFMSSNSILNVQNAEVYGGDCIKSDTSDPGIYSNDGTAGVAINLVVASNSTVNIEGSTISGGHGVNHDYASFKQGEGYKQASGGMAFQMNQTNTINIKDSIIKGGHSELHHGGHAIEVNAGVFDIKTSAIIGGNGNTSDGYGAGKAIFVVTSGSGGYTIDGLSTTTDGGPSN